MASNKFAKSKTLSIEYVGNAYQNPSPNMLSPLMTVPSSQELSAMSCAQSSRAHSGRGGCSRLSAVSAQQSAYNDPDVEKIVQHKLERQASQMEKGH